MQHMSWMLVAVVGLSTAGLLVLGWCSLLVHRQVAALCRELDAGARRVAAAARDLEQAGTPVIRKAGEMAPGRILPFTGGETGRA